jgi:hypothetical protein
MVRFTIITMNSSIGRPTYIFQYQIFIWDACENFMKKIVNVMIRITFIILLHSSNKVFFIFLQ